jgi:group I intron endonuclease
MIDSLKVPGVYALIHRDTLRVYIGQAGRSVYQRVQRHKMLAKRGATACIHAAIRQFGIDAFDVELLEEISETALRLQREEFWILFFKSAGPAGFNVLEKGNRGPLGHGHSAATRARISANHRGGPRVGHTTSIETRQKMRRAHLGKVFTADHRYGISAGMKKVWAKRKALTETP